MIEFNPELARKYGLVEAIILQRLKLLQEKNAVNYQNYYNNTHWVDLNNKVYNAFLYFIPLSDVDFALEKLVKLNVLNTLKSGDTTLYSIYDKYLNVVYTQQQQQQ